MANNKAKSSLSTSSVIDRVTEHFDSKSTRTIEVPEWGNEDEVLTIYVSPMTLSQRNRIYKGKGGNIDMSVMVDAIILKAQDKDGERLFSRADRLALMNHADDAVVARVASFIIDLPDDEEIEGN